MRFDIYKNVFEKKKMRRERAIKVRYMKGGFLMWHTNDDDDVVVSQKRVFVFTGVTVQTDGAEHVEVCAATVFATNQERRLDFYPSNQSHAREVYHSYPIICACVLPFLKCNNSTILPSIPLTSLRCRFFL